ncbi:MAG: acetolactate synthase [Ilumatobacter coccineus]|uniref:Acetolactate synthase n=1 Tax=Ilumatobacter coccineus TaxID=467094 RepID=A0A2G6KFP1_9ACTN|nr:MAG: acetolactate synthase [Ilumatobacter coccineus]
MSEVLHIDGHAGFQAIAALEQFGTDVMFTLNGGHIWPFYEAARESGMKIIDTRHEQSATFAAEAYAKLTRRPGLAALTAGPGVTNGISAVTSARFNGAPTVVVGGRAPAGRWGAGSLQEFDHVPVMAPITKHAATVSDATMAGADVYAATKMAMEPHRGPVFLDFPLDVFGPSAGDVPAGYTPTQIAADPAHIEGLATAIAQAERPALLIGSDAYWAGAWDEVEAVAQAFDVPCFFNGLGRGMLPADHSHAFMRIRSLLKQRADLVVVVGTPLDFRIGFGHFGDARVIHVVDHSSLVAEHVEVTTVVGDIAATLAGLANWTGDRRDHRGWLAELTDHEEAARAAELPLLTADHDPIKPSRIYGELRRRLERDAVVVCDGGDFVSYAGRYVEVQQPGGWLDTGPFGCLGSGLGSAIAARVVRPDAQIVLLLGDGAAGFSLMDVDTLVRHNLPVVMVVGNNGLWGLEKHPMLAIYGWDVACDLQPDTPYDEIVKALGGGGETVTSPAEVGPALDRAFASGVPYLVNVMTDPADVYPRSSNLA